MNKLQAASAFSPDCAVVRAGESFVGKQGFTYAAAISAESVGAGALHMQILAMPPGVRGKAHKHAAHETAIYVLSGEAGTWHGECSRSISSAAPAISSTSPPTRRICLQPERDRALRRGSSRAPIPTSRRASSCCRSSTRSTLERAVGSRLTSWS